MANPATQRLSRNERRAAFDKERRLRKSGDWPAWKLRQFLPGSAGTAGWAAEFTRAHLNEVFCVLDRNLPDGTRHLMISSLTGERPTWWEAQRIKNEIAGVNATAVEVYPPQAEVVDDADAYHLWILPAPLGFSLHPANALRMS